MRALGRIIVVVVLVVILLLVVGLLVGYAKVHRKYDIAPQALTLSRALGPGDASRGEHFASAINLCSDCHAAGLKGQVFLDVPPFRVVAPNLTRGKGGVGTTFSDADFIRAIRHGVAPDGHGLLVMPTGDYANLSDQDLADIIAYVKSVPPVDNVLPATQVKPLGLLLVALNALPPPDAATMDHTASHPAAVTPAVSQQYGSYLVRIAGCTGCHGVGLAGGKIAGLPPDAPVAQNLTPAGIGNWTIADFSRALRDGKRPDGSSINELMPWPYYTRMTDNEIHALWLYIHSVPAKASGTH